MQLSKSTIENMGFREISNEMELEATLSLVKVYQVEGITLKKDEANFLADLCHENQEFVFEFRNSLNEVCQYLLNEGFIDDKEKWMKDNDATPPFLIVYISLNKLFTCRSGYLKKEKEGNKEIISIYNCFSEEKRSLQDKKSKVIPQLITSLWVCLSSLSQSIRLRPIFCEVCIKTKLGEPILDLEAGKLLGKGKVSTEVNLVEVKTRIQDSLKLYNTQLDSKVTSFLHAALKENDRLKQFLNFFFVLEIHTHQVFKKIDFQNYVMKVNNIPDRIQASGKKFFLEQQAESKTLSQRFHWCALLVWEKIDDKDIENFKSIKKVRDQIVHGENVPEATLPIDLAEKLCLKLLSSYCVVLQKLSETVE